MSLAWLVECKICTLRFAVLPRRMSAGKSTDALPAVVGRAECPHCHEFADYVPADLIPGEGGVIASLRDDFAEPADES